MAFSKFVFAQMLVYFFLVPSKAHDFTLNPIPTTACIGHPQGTASYTSTATVPTGELLMDPGSYWGQAGVSWKWILKDADLSWDGPGGIPGYGSPENLAPAAAESAFVLSSDNKTISFQVPASMGDGFQVVIFGTSPTTATSSLSNIATTQASQVSSKSAGLSVPANPASIVKRGPVDAAYPEITSPPNVLLNSAKYRGRSQAQRGLEARQDPVVSGGQMTIVFHGATPCAGPSVSSASVSGNPSIASSCSNNEISVGTAAFSTYQVSSYMSSLLSAAQPDRNQVIATAPVDGAAVIQSDVNPQGPKCTYSAQCNSIGCADVKDYNTGTILSVQRFLAYQTVVNFNNYLHNLYEALYKASEISGLISSDIVSTFYTNPSPDATWQQVLGLITPFLGFMSAALGPIAGEVSAAIGAASSLLSEASGTGTVAQLAAVTEASFSEYASITDFIAKYVQTVSQAIGNCYDRTIGSQTYIYEWAGNPVAPDDQRSGLFGDGTFSDNDFTQGLTTNAQTAMAKIFAYKAINFALVDSNNFIMYVPYGVPVMGSDGNMVQAGINEDYCKNQLKHSNNQGTLLVCDAPGGMARIFNAGSAGTAADLEGSEPQGWDSNFQIVPGENFRIGDAIKGSIASWQAGDFGYDASDPYNQTFRDGTISAQQLTQLGQLDISQSTAGFFNVPVCQLLDLRSFPPASGLGCTACDTSVAVGGTKGSTVKFWDKVPKKMQQVLESSPNGLECANNMCADTVCNFDPYTG